MFSLPLSAKACSVLGLLTCTACVGGASKPDPAEAPPVFYTVTGEIALSRHEVRIAALEYAAAAESARDSELLRRATEVTALCLQPSLTLAVAARWLDVDPKALDADRAMARAALDLHHIGQSVAHYRRVLDNSPQGADAEFEALEADLGAANNVYGARQVADQLAKDYPASPGALRVQAFAALRADDPAAAAKDFEAALSAAGGTTGGAAGGAPGDAAQRELIHGWWRARILAGDRAPLVEARLQMEGADTAENRLDYALLLLAAQQLPEARAELSTLMLTPAARPVALRLLGLLDFQDGQLDAAGMHFAELLTTGKYPDDALYYLGMIAERHKDWDRALHLYADVQSGDNAVPAMVRAAGLLRAHGAAPAADELLDQLMAEAPQRAPGILTEWARIVADGGDLPGAMAVLEHGELEYPDSVDLRYAKASLAEEQGRLGAALDELKAVLRLRPSDPAALNAYGYTLADHHRHLSEARALIEKAHAAAPLNVAILDSLGWVLFRQGHDAEALPYLQSAFADERDGDVAAHLGEVLWRLGRHAEAERIWSAADDAGGENHLLNATRLRLHAAN